MVNYLTNSSLEASLAYNRGTDLLNAGRIDKAINFLKKSIKLEETREAYINLGACYQRKFMLSAAIAAFKDALRLDPDYTFALNNLGMVYHMQGYEATADKLFSRCLEIDPSYSDARWNSALSLLKLACSGHTSLFPLGWERYEARFTKSGAVPITRSYGTRWDGSVGAGSRMLVLTEQGIGDNIQFSRYIPYLFDHFDVTVQVPPEQSDLFTGLKTTSSVVDTDYWVPICSLAMYFDFIPTGTYIGCKEKTVSGGFGIVWAGNPTHGNDKNRSRREKEFSRFKKYGTCYSLQYGVKSKEFENLEIKRFRDTMEIINGLDAVICVDTSVAHLAGAMGKKTFLLLPELDSDFRWGLESSENLWYPSVEIIRNMNFAEAERRVAEYARSL